VHRKPFKKSCNGSLVISLHIVVDMLFLQAENCRRNQSDVARFDVQSKAFPASHERGPAFSHVFRVRTAT
jgi:hypothetical protein